MDDKTEAEPKIAVNKYHQYNNKRQKTCNIL